MEPGNIFKLKPEKEEIFIQIFKIVDSIRPGKWSVLIIETRDKTVMTNAAMNEDYILLNYDQIVEA